MHACTVYRDRRRGRAVAPVFSVWLAVLAAAWGTVGCAAFPRGAYWPDYRGELVPAAGEAEQADGGASAPSGAASGTARPVARRAGASSPPTLGATWADSARLDALRARLRAAVARRWRDEALAESARDLRPAVGRYLYQATLEALVWLYVDPVGYGDLVAAGLESLRAALEDETFRARFPVSADAAKRARFAEALEVLALKARAAKPLFGFQAAEWLDVTMEKNRRLLGLPDGVVAAEMLFGATDALDPYTRLMTAPMRRAYREEVEGRYVGIGASITRRDGRVFFLEVFPDGPAARAGLEAGDLLVAVGGTPVDGMTLGEVVRRLRGRAGTEVVLTVRRRGGRGPEERLVLRRARVRVPPVRGARLLEGPERVGYLRLTAFTPGAAAALRRSVASLVEDGARAVVLDLRGNPGGSLLEAVEAAAVFLGRGRVLRTRGRLLGTDWGYDVPWWSRPVWEGPLAVLVDGGTASAAEALAAALQAQERAVLVGRRTYGKGAAQITVDLAWTDCALVVTVARVYDPKGRCLEGTGLVPDRPVPRAAAPAARPEADPDVRAATEALFSSNVSRHVVESTQASPAP